MIIDTYSNDYLSKVIDTQYGVGSSEYIVKAFRYYSENNCIENNKSHLRTSQSRHFLHSPVLITEKSGAGITFPYASLSFSAVSVQTVSLLPVVPGSQPYVLKAFSSIRLMTSIKIQSFILPTSAPQRLPPRQGQR